TYTVGGSIIGLTGTGLRLKLNGGTNYDIAAGATDFTFPDGLLDGSTYSVTLGANPLGQTCTVSNGSGTISGADVESVQVECNDLPPESHKVGGKVSGLTGTGLVLQINGGEQRTIKFNGTYQFNTGIVTDASYEVIILSQPS